MLPIRLYSATTTTLTVVDGPTITTTAIIITFTTRIITMDPVMVPVHRILCVVLLGSIIKLTSRTSLAILSRVPLILLRRQGSPNSPVVLHPFPALPHTSKPSPPYRPTPFFVWPRLPFIQNNLYRAAHACVPAIRLTSAARRLFVPPFRWFSLCPTRHHPCVFIHCLGLCPLARWLQTILKSP